MQALWQAMPPHLGVACREPWGIAASGAKFGLGGAGARQSPGQRPNDEAEAKADDHGVTDNDAIDLGSVLKASNLAVLRLLLRAS